MRNRRILAAALLAAAVFLCGCGGEALPLKEKENISKEGLYISGVTAVEIFSDEVFALPKVTVYNADGQDTGLKTAASVYDHSFGVVYTDSGTKLAAGNYTIEYKLTDASLSARPHRINAVCRDRNEAVIYGFDGAVPAGTVIPQPTLNFGTTGASFKLMAAGYAESLDGVLKITPNPDAPDPSKLREGAGIMLPQAIATAGISCVRIRFYQESASFNERTAAGVYTAAGPSWDYWWRTNSKNAWYMFEIPADEIAAWGGSADYANRKPTGEITGIYLRGVFGNATIYIDDISVVYK
jgi:hypothetical protein